MREGDVFDSGPGHNTGEIQELCTILGLSPADITDYEYVDLSVRAAALALARKLVMKQRSASRAKSRRPTKKRP